MAWHSVRCIIRLDAGYEERITMWDAASFDEAIAQAESEAHEYAEILGGTLVGLAQAFRLDESQPLGHGAEVFSLIRQSDLEPDAYVDAFFDTGGEYQQTS